jgi:hypothetical protein
MYVTTPGCELFTSLQVPAGPSCTGEKVGPSLVPLLRSFLPAIFADGLRMKVKCRRGSRHQHYAVKSVNCAYVLDLLRRANSQIEHWCRSSLRAATPGTLEELRVLSQVEALLEEIAPLLRKGLQHVGDDELRAEVAAYKRNLIRLQHQLATISPLIAESEIQVFESSTPRINGKARVSVSRVC